MVHKTVLKVDISCHKCKKKLLKAVSALQGVDKIEVDEAKGTLTVTGNADPYEIIVRTKKAGKFVEVVSIGPPPNPPKQDNQKKPDDKDKKPDQKAAQVYLPPFPYNYSYPAYPYYPPCDRVAVVHVDRWDDPNSSCSIL